MTRFLLLFLLLFCFNLSAQTPCLPTANGIPAGDEPPGCYLCGPIYQGSTIGFTPDSVDFDFPCGTIENSQWLSILSDQSGTLQITVLSTNCEFDKGIEFAIYDKDLNIVSNCFSSNGENFPGNVIASGLDSEEIYYVMIDGFEGDQCDFLMSISSGIILTPPPSPVTISIIPNNENPCPGDVICYSTDRITGATTIDWLVPNNSKIISGGQIEDNFVCVEYFENGIGDIQIIPSNFCFLGIPLIIEVEVSPRVNLTSITLCPGESIEIDSIQYNSTIQTDIIYPLAAASGCDSILRLDLTISDITPTEIICTPDSFLNALAIEWIEPDGAEEYELFINDSLVAQQSHNTYIFLPENGADSTKIELLPKNSRGCNFQKTKMVCANPKLTSSKNLIENQLKIFPNPTKNTVRIEADFLIESIQIFDFSGKKVLFSKEKVIDLSSFSAGVYILKIRSENQTFIRKVIKI